MLLTRATVLKAQPTIGLLIANAIHLEIVGVKFDPIVGGDGADFTEGRERGLGIRIAEAEEIDIAGGPARIMEPR